MKPYETENESFIFNFTKPAYKGIVHKVISLSFDDPVLSVFLPSCFDTPLLFPKSLLQLEIKKSRTIVKFLIKNIFYLQNPQKQKLINI